MRSLLVAALVALAAVGSAQSPARFAKPARPAPSSWLVCHGDSITEGYGATGYRTTHAGSYCVQAAAAVAGQTVSPVLLGINGQGLNYVYSVYPSNTFGTLTADAVTRVDPILSQTGTKYLVIFAGTNDIFLNGTSGAATWTLLETYINARITAGWTAANICVGTMLPRQGSNESARSTLNGSIRSNAAGIGYKVCDFAANATIGDAGDENNTTYYIDTIHPNDAGHAILAQIVKDTLFP